MGLAVFEKYEGLGNDFVVLDATDESSLGRERAIQLCDRRLGVGADGVILLLPPVRSGSVARMKVYNADGSVPEMCGNGLRCAALHIARARGMRSGDFVVDTDSGPRRCSVAHDAEQARMTIEMGAVRLCGERSLVVNGAAVDFTLADAGNPHAIAFGDHAPTDIERIGPVVSTHPSFANGTNVELATMVGDRIDLVVWERGVGITHACGTGACATAVVACAKGLTPFDAFLTVRLPGGDLAVRIDRATHHAVMCGPARHVFSGRLS